MFVAVSVTVPVEFTLNMFLLSFLTVLMELNKMAKGANALPCPPATASDESDDEDPVTTVLVSSSARGAPTKKPPRKRFVVMNLSKCRYHIVRQAALELGWCIEDEDRTDVPTEYAKSSDHAALLEKLFPCFRYRPEETPQIHWVDCSVLLPRVAALKCFQRLNHFPNMHLLCRKMLFFSRCMKMRERFPGWYTFFPKSYSLRTDEKALQEEVRSLRGKVKTFLMKPNAGCQGKGIILTRNPVKEAKHLKDQDYIVQYYVHRPLLIDGKKFDMRVYVLMTMCGAANDNSEDEGGRHWSGGTIGGGLELYVHTEGLVRICATPYSKPTTDNLGDVCKHLTNYSVNKESEDYAFAGAEGADEAPSDISLSNEGDGTEGFTSNKRDFRFLETFVNETMQSSAGSNGADGGGGDEDDDDEPHEARTKGAASNTSTPWQQLLRKVDRAIVLSVMSALHDVRHAYQASGSLSGQREDGRNSFELMGFDVLVTRSGNVHVLEINHSPSLFCDTVLDVRIKKNVLKDTLRIISKGVPDLRKCSDVGYRKYNAKMKAKGELTIPANSGFRSVFPLLAAKEGDEAVQAYHDREMQIFHQVWEGMSSNASSAQSSVLLSRRASKTPPTPTAGVATAARKSFSSAPAAATVLPKLTVPRR